ncbi:unnamed protein product [Natator depressus]
MKHKICRNLCVKNGNCVVTNSKEVVEVWKKHCERLLNEKRELQVQALLRIIEKPEKLLVSREQVEAAPNQMKTGEVVGDDEITVDMIQAVGHSEVREDAAG